MKEIKDDRKGVLRLNILMKKLMIVDRGTSKATIIILVIIIFILAGILVYSVVTKDKQTNSSSPVVSENYEEISDNKEVSSLDTVPTMQDKISGNRVWCGTFQLVWNDMQNNLVEGDVKFNEPNEMVDNLNKQTFTEDSISDEYYYKKWGLVSSDLKEEIASGIKEKFNETSDILDVFDWTEEKDKYLFYTMLRRDFEFENEFTILEKNKFGNEENVEFFGINSETEESVRNQVEVLYYTNENDFAVVLYTKQGDNVMIVRNPEGKTFEEIYINANEKASNDSGSKTFGEKDTLSVPNLNIANMKRYYELENKPFKNKDNEPIFISQAYQTIKMTLNNKGGSVKSEAGLITQKYAGKIETDPRDFNFNDKFTMFLLSDSNTPYFALNVEDIKDFQ